GLVTLIDRVDYRALRDALRKQRETNIPMGAVPKLAEGIPAATGAELKDVLLEVIRTPLSDRIWYIVDALRIGCTIAEIQEATYIDPWFLEQLKQIVDEEPGLRALVGKPLPAEQLRKVKTMGFSDVMIGQLTGRDALDVRRERKDLGVTPVFARVDSCAAEFEALTPYMYSTWGSESEARPTDKRKIMILGGGPNRIGQGIEFDYCCVHAAFALRELGFETIMVNCNPETVSTDYDTSDRLYFEPLTFEDVMNIIDVEQPEGVIVQFGGQTPLRLAKQLERAGVNILGTPAEGIDRAEDRERFDELLTKLDLRRPRGGIAHGVQQAFEVAERIGYPVLVRPSYVLGGRAMEIVYSAADLARYMREAFEALEDAESTAILIDEFLKDAIEVDVDCLADRETVVIGGIMQHIEEAGIHSGDSASVLPAHALPPEVLGTIRSSTRALALELGVIGLMNVQYAIRGSAVYVIEVNPRASRTVPFVSKTIGVPLAKVAAKLQAGKTLKELGFLREVIPPHVSVKESVFPFAKFPGVDTLLGPEMRSTGEVMGIAKNFAEAFHKAAEGASIRFPKSGLIFISVRDADKQAAGEVARQLVELGFSIVATKGTAASFARIGVQAQLVKKFHEGQPTIVDLLRDGNVAMVVNTTEGDKAIRDSYSLRRQALVSAVPYFTTIAAATAAVAAIDASTQGPLEVRSLQEYHAATTRRPSLGPTAT
ncbi:MAG: Carbamoyl-phosphate synthase large chain, partial [Myxococcaceae bacterium]|nr:Carbamoyl-phosphate synthase large chain [Myxococcaceae bacterium]